MNSGDWFFVSRTKRALVHFTGHNNETAMIKKNYSQNCRRITHHQLLHVPKGTYKAEL